MQTNLWYETLYVLEDNDRVWSDVKYIHTDEYQIGKNNFKQVAKEIDYDNEEGMRFIQGGLTIVGVDFKMLRREHCGNQYWEFISFKPNLPKEKKVITIDDICLDVEDMLSCYF